MSGSEWAHLFVVYVYNILPLIILAFWVLPHILQDMWLWKWTYRNGCFRNADIHMAMKHFIKPPPTFFSWIPLYSMRHCSLLIIWLSIPCRAQIHSHVRRERKMILQSRIWWVWCVVLMGVPILLWFFCSSPERASLLLLPSFSQHLGRLVKCKRQADSL